MNFEWNSDQRAVMDMAERLAQAHGSRAILEPVRGAYAPQLQQQLQDSGLAGCLAEPGLGACAALGMVMALSHPLACVELTGSMLVAPLLGLDLPGACALLGGDAHAVARFLPVARTVVRVQGQRVHVAELAGDGVVAVPSVFAYPMGRLHDPGALAWRDVAGVDGSEVLRLWRLGVAAEMVGSLQAALGAVTEHVRERRQFGRPLGAFQAVQHRLAQCATSIEGARWLCLHAAHTATQADALLALGQAGQIATPVCYDLHQFMGAMGLTLEHPLHRWTYRAKWLRSELGGAAEHWARAADLAWGHMEEEHTA